MFATTIAAHGASRCAILQRQGVGISKSVSTATTAVISTGSPAVCFAAT
ncbi:hypothetical protein [Acidocella aminolytica]|nr:hypothetical protein [Acidocella aminolytica]